MGSGLCRVDDIGGWLGATAVGRSVRGVGSGGGDGP